MRSALTEDRVTILLATYNGAPWLDEQLRSIEEQSYPGQIDIVASDDGSIDGTVQTLEAWRQRWKRGAFTVEGNGAADFAENFRSLIQKPLTDATQYVAYSDQDDVWLPDKLSTAIDVLRKQRSTPALYCGRTLSIDETGRTTHESPAFTRQATFRNALVQSIAGGNTMVMNRAAFDMIQQASKERPFVSHDWFSYLIVSGAGGVVHYDLAPNILYRQHGSNVVGTNRGFLASVQRFFEAMGGRYKSWNSSNLASLRGAERLLTDEARSVIELFERARTGSVIGRLINLKRSGVYRQTARGQLSLYLACMLGKI